MVFNTQNKKKQRLVADQVTPQLLEDIATSANRLKKKACSFFSINLKKSVNSEPYSGVQPTESGYRLSASWRHPEYIYIYILIYICTHII